MQILLALMVLLLCACGTGGKRDNTYTIKGTLLEIGSNGFTVKVINDESGNLQKDTEILCYISAEDETNIDIVDKTLYVSGNQVHQGDVLELDYIYYYLETTGSGCKVRIYNIDIVQ